jgi:plasmid maintenance system antidote protein VapI
MSTQDEFTTRDQVTRTGKLPITEALQNAIAKSGLTYYAIERLTGVKRQSIMYFMRSQRSLRLNIADRLAVYFGLEVRPKQKG